MRSIVHSFCFVIALLCSVPLAARHDIHDSIPESARLLSAYIQHRSISGNEHGAGRFLAAVCRAKGLYVNDLSEEDGTYNFSASLYPLESGKPNIVLLNHIDVVPPGDTLAWQFSPFSGIIFDGMVWGRGAIDLKGLAIMQLMAIKSLQNQSAVYDLPYNVTMLCVSQEESTNAGARFVVERHFGKLAPAVVFGEGGAGIAGLIESRPEEYVFCISTAEKQALWLRVTVSIKTSGHGSVPPTEYANQVLVKELAKLTTSRQRIRFNQSTISMFTALGNLEKGYRGAALRHIKVLKPFVAPVLRSDPKILAVVSNTIAITQIRNFAGSSNQIAQEAVATLDCRLLPGVNAQDFIHTLRKKLSHRNLTIDIEHHTCGSEVSVISNTFYKVFKESIRKVYPDAEVMPYLFPAYTDNNFFRQKGIPVYGIKPIKLSASLLESVHNVDERLPIASLEQGIEVYHEFLTRLMQSTVVATSNSNH